MKLYVVWTGTDAQGKVLLSSDSRFSAFPPNRIQENVMAGVNSALGQLESIKDSVTGAVNDVSDKITGAAEEATDFFTGNER